MTSWQRIRRQAALLFWRLFNPVGRALAGIAPWWVVLETTGHRSGLPRQVPLARGPVDGDTVWLISVHGTHAAFVKNLLAQPRVRLKLNGRWREGTATLTPVDREIVRRFNLYARSGPLVFGIEPKLVRVDLQ